MYKRSGNEISKLTIKSAAEELQGKRVKAKLKSGRGFLFLRFSVFIPIQNCSYALFLGLPMEIGDLNDCCQTRVRAKSNDNERHFCFPASNAKAKWYEWSKHKNSITRKRIEGGIYAASIICPYSNGMVVFVQIDPFRHHRGGHLFPIVKAGLYCCRYHGAK